jgi:DNA-binding LacI/PurR family transcriptional regulator
MVTIKDVAKYAGVSIKTVSRVVNNLSEVSPETRQKVQHAILELGYQPNLLARSLVNGKTNTVGVVIPRSADYISDHPFFSEVLRGITEALSAQEYNVFLHLASDKVPYAKLYTQRRVDGLILMSIPMDDPNIPALEESGAPYVATCRIAEDDKDSNFVDADFAGGVQQAMEHLITLGHHRIALLAGPMNLVSVHLRVTGYRNALTEHDLPIPRGYIQECEFSSEAGYTLAVKFMDKPEPPTALLCGNDLIAFGVIQALKERGHRVPEDVSVIGFDDISLARYSSPPLTTVRQDTFKKGRLAADSLLTRMQNKTDMSPQQIILDTSLVIRETTAPAQIR